MLDLVARDTCPISSCAGIECDLSVGQLDGAFKCRVLRSLAAIDPRFPALVRVVKAWTTARALNDASKMTLNTYSIVLLVRHSETLSESLSRVLLVGYVDM